MEIKKGKQASPVKGIVYGQAGIGKTTFAAKWPRPLFIDVENGSGQLEVDRVTPRSYPEFKAVLQEIMKDPCGYRTLVIDSADKLEQMIIFDICNANNIKTIEQYEKGYGKGWNHLVELWGKLLDYLDRIRITHEMNILFVGHSVIKRYEPADDAGYDRYTLSVYQKSGDLLKAWSDLLLFVRYDVVSQTENGRNKACGNVPRVMHAQFHPCWDAKNRYGLPDKMSFDFVKINGIFGAAATAAAPVPAPSKPSAAPSKAEPTNIESHAPAKAPEPAKAAAVDAPADNEKEEALSQLRAMMEVTSVDEADVRAQIEKKGVVPVGTPIENYNLATLRRIVNGWTAILHNIEISKGK